MSGSAASLPARSPARRAIDVRARGRATAWALAGCVGLAALSLLWTAQPTYDPWSWILWGREILHLDLVTTDGPSWKPLPVAFTTVFALFGDAAPQLWVLVARAGALAGALAAFLLGRRLAGPRAGALAALVLLVAPWYVRNAALANSEGLQVALALGAVERGVAGRRATAFWLGLGLALLRPEAWPFLGLYGLWLARRERGRLPGVLAGFAVLPLAWLVPEQLGSGDWLRAAHRAQDPVSGTPADARNPLAEVLREGWDMLGGGSALHWGLIAAVVLVAWRRDARLGRLLGLVAAWTLIVGLMTATGYSGNTRYLMVPAALATVVTAAAILGAVPRPAAPLAALALAAAFALGWSDRTTAVLDAVRYQADLTGELGTVVARAGGADRVTACGPVATGPYLVPAVAWALGLHIGEVRLVPEVPGTTLRVRTTGGAPAAPTLSPLAGRPVRTLAVADSWRIVTTCGAGA